jgi:hypothetical protein
MAHRTNDIKHENSDSFPADLSPTNTGKNILADGFADELKPFQKTKFQFGQKINQNSNLVEKSLDKYQLFQ